jgi:hypothetical protein
MKKVILYTIASLVFAGIILLLMLIAFPEGTDGALIMLVIVSVLISLWGAIIVTKIDELKGGNEPTPSDAPQRKCPQCEKEHDSDCSKCPHCSHEY